VRTFEPRVVDQLYFPQEWYDTIIEGLQGVMQPAPLDGTADEAFEDFPFTVFPMAGKTGTVEGVGKQDSAVFVGFGPLPEAEYVMFTYVEEGGFGGDTAAPIVRRVFEAIANDDIDTVPTKQQVEEFYRQFAASELDELGLTGDAVTDLAQGFDPSNPSLTAPAVQTDPADEGQSQFAPADGEGVEPAASADAPLSATGDRSLEEQPTDQPPDQTADAEGAGG